MIMGDTDLVPYDAGTLEATTPQMGPQLRKAAATARKPCWKWRPKTGILPLAIKTENGMIINAAANKKLVTVI
jgi:hypothetical protein